MLRRLLSGWRQSKRGLSETSAIHFAGYSIFYIFCPLYLLGGKEKPSDGQSARITGLLFLSTPRSSVGRPGKPTIDFRKTTPLVFVTDYRCHATAFNDERRLYGRTRRGLCTVCVRVFVGL